MAAVIATTGLTKDYGSTRAVDHLDLTVEGGEVFGLLGPNGAGKTTTILMLLGLAEPTSGKASVAGFDPTRQPLQVKRMVGYLPDNVGFYEGLTGRQNLRYTARLNGLDPKAAEERIDALLDEVGLVESADRPAGTYSRGMRQRLGIADALVKDPRVLILDEPTVAIDPEGVAEILALIRRLADERGVTLLLSSHLLHQVQSVCDRVGIFVAGRLEAVGTVEELARRSPSHRTLAVAAGPGDARPILESIASVTEVEPDPAHPGGWQVTSQDDVAGEVARALVGAGMTLHRLAPVEPDLDLVYRSLHLGRPTEGSGHG